MDVPEPIKKLWRNLTAGDKILVTGGLGYIGSHTVVELIQSGYDVLITDNLSNTSIDVLNGMEKITGVRPQFDNVDCTDYVAMDRYFTKNEDIDAIVHLASLKDVNESVERPLPYYRNNVTSLVNILELMPIHKVEALIFSSSCVVYGNAKKMPVEEKSRKRSATSPYAKTKQFCEDIITDTIHANPDQKAILLRYFNPIGAHPSALIGEMSNDHMHNLVPLIAETAARIHPQVRIFGTDYNTPDGTCLRDYVDVVDLAKAHVAALQRLLNDKVKEYEIYNIGTGKPQSVLNIIHTFEKVNKVKVPYVTTDRREGDVEQVWANCNLANKVLKWEAKESLESSLSSTWKWQLSQMHKKDKE